MKTKMSKSCFMMILNYNFNNILLYHKKINLKLTLADSRLDDRLVGEKLKTPLIFHSLEYSQLLK
jgi:hypothetical protein